MHPIFLVNEGTVAVAMMAVALFIAFGMVIGLGAYVIYCDRLNRAGEARLAHAEAEPAVDQPVVTTAAPAEPGQPAGHSRAKPPPGH